MLIFGDPGEPARFASHLQIQVAYVEAFFVPMPITVGKRGVVIKISGRRSEQMTLSLEMCLGRGQRSYGVRQKVRLLTEGGDRQCGDRKCNQNPLGHLL